MKPEKTDPALVDMITGYGDRLRAARIAAGFAKQIEFARALGVSAVRYHHWEAETHPPNIYHLAKMRQFGIGADWILSGDYQALSQKVFRAMVNLGAAADAPEPARELRQTLPDVPDPDAPASRTLHEPPPLPPTRTIRHRGL